MKSRMARTAAGSIEYTLCMFGNKPHFGPGAAKEHVPAVGHRDTGCLRLGWLLLPAAYQNASRDTIGIDSCRWAGQAEAGLVQAVHQETSAGS